MKPEGIDFFIYDASSPEKERFLYTHPSRTRKTPLQNKYQPETELIKTMTFDVAGRKWMIKYAATPNYIAARRSLIPWGFLLGGLVFTGFVIGFLVVVSHAEDLSVAYTYSRSLIEASLDPFVTINVDGKIMDVNSATEKVTGIMRDKLVGSDFSECFTEPEIARMSYKQVFSQGQVTDFPLSIRHSSGKITDVLYNAGIYQNKQGKIAGVFATARDITARKRAEEKMLQSEEKFRNLFNNAETGMFRSKIDGSEMLDMNQKLLDIIGKTREETQGKPEVILWADPKEREEMIRGLVANGRVADFEHKILNKQGGIRDCLTSVVLYPEQGIMEGSLMDITELKLAKSSLDKSAVEIQDLYNNAPCGYHSLDKYGVIRRINNTELAWLGYKRDETVAKIKLPDLLTPASVETFYKTFPKLIKEGAVNDLELELIRKDGTVFTGLLNATAVYDSSGNFLMTRSTVSFR